MVGNFDQTVTQTAHQVPFFSWNDKIKIEVFGLIEFLSMIALIWICVKCVPFETILAWFRDKRNNKLPTKEDEELGIPLTDIQPSPLIIGAATVPSYSSLPTTSEISSSPPSVPKPGRTPRAHPDHSRQRWSMDLERRMHSSSPGNLNK